MEDQEQPQAVMGATHTLRTRVDGSLSITIDVEPRHAQAAFAMFGAPGTPVAIARITSEAAVQADQQAAQHGQQTGDKPKGPWGHIYQDLWKYGWWHNPRVAFAFGMSMDDTPEERIAIIKDSLYGALNVESLSDLEPQYFVAECDERGIKETVPPSIIEAAAGRAI